MYWKSAAMSRSLSEAIMHRSMTSIVLAVVVVVNWVTSVQSALPQINPVAFTMPTPPQPVGPLAPNNVLSTAEKVHNNLLKGPISFVNHDGHLYTATMDNKIYDASSCPPRLIADLRPRNCRTVRTCGQLLTLRRDPTSGNLIALDTYRGLYSVNPTTGESNLIYSVNTPINGRQPVHLHGMAITSQGYIFMTDASNAYDFQHSLLVCLDGRPSGRLIAFLPAAGKTFELLPNVFSFANSLEFTPDGDLLVTETCRARVVKVSLQAASWLKMSIFSKNLPGLPDNIRSSGRDTYWVAMSYPRLTSTPNPLDSYSKNPSMRAMGLQFVPMQQMDKMFSKSGIVVEIDKDGKLITSLQDPTAAGVTMPTEVNEFGGILHIGLQRSAYIARVVLPATSTRRVTVDSYIQVMRSRCQLQDSQVEETRRRLQQL